MYDRLVRKFILFFAMTMAFTQTWAYTPVWTANAGGPTPGSTGSRTGLVITAMVMHLTQSQLRALRLDYGLASTYPGRITYGSRTGYIAKRPTLALMQDLLSMGITPAAGVSSRTYDGVPHLFSTGAAHSFGRAEITVLPRLGPSPGTVRMDVDANMGLGTADDASHFESSASLTLGRGECVVAVCSEGTGDAMLALIVPILGQ